MDSYITSAIISAMAAIAVCIVNIIYNNKNSKKQEKTLKKTLEHELLKQNRDLTVRYVTDKRVKWINDFREIVSETSSIPT